MISSLLIPTQAGQFFTNIGAQAHRDFAENRGIFGINATDIIINDINGNYVGTIARMANFDGLADAHGGEAALVGHQGFIATCAHDYSNSTLSFTNRFGAGGTIYGDSYKTISLEDAWGPVTDYLYDYRVQRLNKIATEAVAANYATDPDIINNIPAQTLQRAGAGTFTGVKPDGSAVSVEGAYTYLTGGTFDVNGQVIRLPAGTPLPPRSTWPAGVSYENLPTSTLDAAGYENYSFFHNLNPPSANDPMPISALPGDSGSPVYVYNTKNGQWEYIGNTQSAGGGTIGQFTQVRGGPQWSEHRIDNYEKIISPTADNGNITLTGPAAGATQATLTQGSNSWTFTSLSADKRGATSTISANGTTTNEADSASMVVTNNLTLGNAGGTISLANSIDLGAGSITFDGNYTLSNAGDSTRRLNSAGFIINAGKTVTTQLTGISGDEWRVMGDGTFNVTGSGNNAAKLNVGGNTTTLLNRNGGTAATSVKINGGQAVVRLADANQLIGDDSVIFAHRGGTLDLNGSNRSFGKIFHLDNGAKITNYLANSTSQVSIGGNGNQTYLGSFLDNATTNARLDVAYTGANANETWTLRGQHNTNGFFNVTRGSIIVEGEQVIHAGGVTFANDYTVANFKVGELRIDADTNFTASKFSTVTSNRQATVNGTLTLLTGTKYQAPSTNLANANAKLIANIDDNQSINSNIIGSGTIQKLGKGTLELTGNNTFTGSSKIDAGAVAVSNTAALGNANGQWTINSAGTLIARDATFNSLKSKISTTSTGTFALDSTSNQISPDQAPDLAGYGGIYLGASDRVEVGTLNTTNRLNEWANGGGWNLGGGGGELVMNLKLSGTSTLHIGNGVNQGIVTLTNIHNSDTLGGSAFTGAIQIQDGVTLKYTDIRALGAANNNITLVYGTSFALGDISTAQQALSKIHTDSTGVVQIRDGDYANYDFASRGMNSLYLGAEGDATFGGTITAGSNGYLLGGTGKLTVATTLSGAKNVTIDTQNLNTPSGSVIFTRDNTYTGSTTIKANSTLQVGNGGTTGSLSNNSITNNGKLIYNQSDDVTMNNATSGSGELLQNGTGTLTVTANQSTTGKTTINSGTLALGNGNTTGSVGSGEIVNNSRLEINRSGTQTLTNLISGKGSVEYKGNATTTISGANSYTGNTIISSGRVKIANSSALGNRNGNPSSVSIKNGATVDINGVVDLSNGFTIEGNGTDGNGALVNNGAGIGNGYAQTSNLKLSGNASIGGTGNFAMIAGGYAANTLNLGGFTLTKKGTNTFYMANTSAPTTGKIVVESGAMEHYGNFGTQNIDFSNVDLNVATGARYTVNNSSVTYQIGNLQGTGTFQAGSNALSVGHLNQSGTFYGTLSGTGTNTKVGTGTWTIAGTSTLTNSMNVNAGALGLDYSTQNNSKLADTKSLTLENQTQVILSGGSHLEKVSNTIVNGSANLTRTNGSSQLDMGAITFGTGASLDVSAANVGVTTNTINTRGYFDQITIGGGLYATRDTAGNIIDYSNYVDTTRLSSGAKGINQQDGRFVRIIEGSGSEGNLFLMNGGATQMDSLLNTANGGTSTLALDAGQTLRVSEQIVGSSTSGQLIFTGSGNITAGNAANVADQLVIKQNSTQSMMFESAIADNGTGATTLVKDGAGRMITSANNTNTGGNTINNGILQVGNGGTTGNLSGAITNNSILEFNRSDNTSISNVISGSGEVRIAGTGTTTLNAANTFTGKVSVANGARLKLANPSSLGAANTNVDKVDVLNGGTLDIAGVENNAQGVTIAGNGTDGNGALVNNGNSTRTTQVQTPNIKLAENASIGGTGDFSMIAGGYGANTLDLNGKTLTKKGTNTFMLANTTATAGNINIENGTFSQFRASNLAAAQINLSTTNNTTLDTNGQNLRVGSLNGGTNTNGIVKITGTSTLTIGELNQSDTYEGKITGTGTLQKAGTNRMLLTNNNATYTGSVNVLGGKLQAGASGAFGKGAITIQSGAELNIGATSSSYTHDNKIDVSAGAVLSGIATLTNTITVNSGGRFSPGNSPGIVTLSGNTTTFSANSIYNWEILGTNPTTAGTSFDQLLLANNATLSIADGAILSINGQSLDYTTSFWDQNRSFLAVSTDSGNTNGLFTIDTTDAGNYEGQGLWNIIKQGNDVFTTWTVVPEPSTALFCIIGTSTLLLRRRRSA